MTKVREHLSIRERLCRFRDDIIRKIWEFVR